MYSNFICFYSSLFFISSLFTDKTIFHSFFTSSNIFFLLYLIILTTYQISSMRLDPLLCVHWHAFYICNFTSIVFGVCLFVFLNVSMYCFNCYFLTLVKMFQTGLLE